MPASSNLDLLSCLLRYLGNLSLTMYVNVLTFHVKQLSNLSTCINVYIYMVTCIQSRSLAYQYITDTDTVIIPHHD